MLYQPISYFPMRLLSAPNMIIGQSLVIYLSGVSCKRHLACIVWGQHTEMHMRDHLKRLFACFSFGHLDCSIFDEHSMKFCFQAGLLHICLVLVSSGLMDALHRAAFRDTLGNPLYMNPDKVGSFSPQAVCTGTDHVLSHLL